MLSLSSEDSDDLEEVTRMAPGKKSKIARATPTCEPERRVVGTSSQLPQPAQSEPPHLEPAFVDQPSHLASPPTIGSSTGSVLASVSKRVRSFTRGKATEKLMRQIGHAIPVPIPSSSGAPEGEHATSFSNELGKEIRLSVPVRNHSWDKLDAGIQEAIIMKVLQRFDIGDYNNDLAIQETVRSMCLTKYRSWKHELHKYYLALKNKGVPDPKNHPPERVNLNDCVYMIDNVWETNSFKIKSSKAKMSRSNLHCNHTNGSRSFAAAMSIIKVKNGQTPSFPDFYKETHYSKKKNAWVNETAKNTHERLVSKTIEQSQPEVTSLLTELEVSIDILGRRSGYLKGYGIRYKGSSSTRTTAESAARDAEVAALKEQLAMHDKKYAEFEAFVRQLSACVQRPTSGDSAI